MKDLAAYLLPNLALWAVFIAAAVTFRKGTAIRCRRVFAATVAGLFLLSFPVGPRLAADLWSVRGDDPGFLTPDGGGAVMVFGGGIGTDGYGRFWPSSASMRRLSVGRMAAAAHGLPLFVSGGPSKPERPTEARVIEDFLAETSIAVIRDDTARNTWDNAVAARDAASREGWTAVVAVTDELHGRRALACLRAAGVPVAGFLAPRRLDEVTFHDIVPSVRGLALWGAVGYEIAASGVYVLTGRIAVSDLVQ